MTNTMCQTMCATNVWLLYYIIHVYAHNSQQPLINSLPLAFSLCLSLSLSHTHAHNTHSFFRSNTQCLSHTHSQHTVSLSLSLTHTFSHTLNTHTYGFSLTHSHTLLAHTEYFTTHRLFVSLSFTAHTSHTIFSPRTYTWSISFVFHSSPSQV